MPARFSIEVSGKVEFDRAFNRVADKIQDFRFVWPAVSQTFYKIENELFNTKGASGASGRWAPLSQKYALQKAKKYPAGYAAGPMHRTFALRDSLTKRGTGVYRETKDSLELGTNIPYAKMHMKASGRRPARPVIDVSPEGKRDIQKAIQRQLLDYIKTQGFGK